MPTVRNLVTDNPKPNGSTPPETAATPAPKGGDGAALAVPTCFGGLPTLPSNDGLAVANDLSAGASGPYVARASDRSPNWPSLSAAGVGNGDLYLGAEGLYLRTMPLTYWLVASTVFKTLMDDLGNFQHATTDLNAEKSPGGLKLDEHVLALIVVDLGDRLVPAKCDFRGTLSGAVSPTLKAVQQAGDPKWAALSDAHKVAAAFPVPWGRVVATATTQPRTSRASGRKYYAGAAVCRPATIAQMQRLQAATQDAAFTALLEQAKQGYAERFETIRAMCK